MGIPGDPPRQHRRRERAAHDGTRTDEREKSEREEGGGWPEPREATRREPPSRRETDALPRDAPRLLTTPRFQAGGRGRALESGRNAGESGMIPDPLRAGSEDREPAERETTHRANGLGGRDGRRATPRTRGGGGGDRDAAKSRAARVLGNAAGEAVGGERRRHADGLSLEGREGGRRGPRRTDGPDLGDGESHRPEPPPSPHRREKKARKWGVSHRQAPNPVRWRFPTRDAPSRRTTTTTTGPEESPDAPRTADPPPRRRRRTSAKPPSLARFPKRAKPASLAPSRTDPPPRQTRPPPPKDPPAATGPDASGDAPGDDRPPFSKGRTRERGHDPAKPEPDPRPRGGTGQPLLPNRGNAAGEGERGDSHTAHNTSDARTRRAQRGRGPRERQRRGSAGGTARGGHGRRTGGTREPTATQPRSLPCSAPRPDRGAYAPSGERGDRGPAALGRAHTRPLRSPPRVTRPGLRHDTPASRHALLSRVVPPRTRSEEARAAVGDTNARVSPPKDGTRRGAPGRSYAHREVRACWGDQAGRRETPSTPAHRIAREGTLFSLRAGGTDPARRASGRGSARAGGATHTPLDDLERSEAGGPAVSARLLLPFRGAFLSVRGHRGPDREKTMHKAVPREPGLPLQEHPPGLTPGGEAFSSIDRPPTFNGEKKKGRPRPLNTTQRSQPTGEGSARWAARPTSSAHGGEPQRASYRFASTPFIIGVILTQREHTSQRNTAKGRTAHRRHTRQRTGKRRRRSEPGTSEDRPGTLQEHQRGWQAGDGGPRRRTNGTRRWADGTAAEPRRLPPEERKKERRRARRRETGRDLAMPAGRPVDLGEAAGERRGGFASGRPARTRKKHTRKAGRDRQTRGPRPTTHRRTGHAEASPTGAREGAPQPRPRRASGTATRRVRNGSPREPPDADGSLGPPRPPDPGDGEATPPGVFKPTRRNAVARYPDRGRGRRREREDRRRDDAPGRAPSRDTGSVRHARPGATARGRAGRRRGALPFPPRRGGTRTRTTPQKQNTEEPDGKEGTHPRAAAVR
ncbi:serine/arginine repetitive matrix protein 1-like [Chionomys nivalis]|uniref:serine/arginine repetitive matrix protein 1-like n=1 Tax=Chionomys nivalis TaxID=269649 RepID=UPI0025971227|nr:serine/arginine repetitive matrix protein 1-like [Chionomys nivalis]